MKTRPPLRPTFLSNKTPDADKAQRPALYRGVPESRQMPFRQTELREKPDGHGGTTLEFNGYASVTDTPYQMYDMFGPYTEIVRRGAFTKTIADGCDTAFLTNHEGLSLARTKSGTLRLAEDSIGLHANADLDAARADVQALRSGIDRGDIDEMSFAFRTIRQEWSPDYDQRDLIELSLDKGDVSAVNYGANPHTSGPGISLRLLEMRAGGDPSKMAALARRHAQQANWEKRIDIYRARAYALRLRGRRR